MLDFIKSGFSTSLGYTAIERSYMYEGKPHIGYVLVKNYRIFWIPGYDRVGVFIDKASMNEYLEKNFIKLN